MRTIIALSCDGCAPPTIAGTNRLLTGSLVPELDQFQEISTRL